MSLNGPTDDYTPDDPDEAGASGAPYPSHDDPAEWTDEGRYTTNYASPGPLPNRMTGDTALGCVGMLCLIATLALLGIGFGGLGLPFWFTALTPVLAFGVAGIGFALMARVPTGPPPRSRDPLHPLTRSGMAPVLERPADLANRLMVGAGGALVAGAFVGYLILSFDPNHVRGVFWGPIVMTLAGVALVLVGALVSLHTLPTPALHWVRTPIQGRPARAVIWLYGVGADSALSGVFLAFISGAVWGYVLVGALILTLALSVMAYTFWQRRPRRRRLPPGYYAYSTRRSDGPFPTRGPLPDHPYDEPPDTPANE